MLERDPHDAIDSLISLSIKATVVAMLGACAVLAAVALAVLPGL